MRSGPDLFKVIEDTEIGQREGMVQLIILATLVEIRDLLQPVNESANANLEMSKLVMSKLKAKTKLDE